MFLKSPCAYCGALTVPEYDITKRTAIFRTPPCETCGHKNRVEITDTENGGHVYRLFRDGRKPSGKIQITIDLTPENYEYIRPHARPRDGTAGRIINKAIDAMRESEKIPGD